MTFRQALAFTIAVLLMFTLGACRGGDEADTPAAVPETPSEEAMTSDLPDTTGPAVWDYLQEVAYADNWAFWPDKSPLYPGTEPHGMLLNTYLNEPALEGVEQPGAGFADGAILVKENYMPDSSLAAVTVMYKAADYNPEHNDWFWSKYEPDGTIEAAGRVESCQSCHASEPDGNYIMTGDL